MAENRRDTEEMCAPTPAKRRHKTDPPSEKDIKPSAAPRAAPVDYKWVKFPLRRVVRVENSSKIFNPLATSTPKAASARLDVVRKSSLLITKMPQVLEEGTADKPIVLSPPPSPPPMTQRFTPKSPSYSPQRAMDIDTSLISTDVSQTPEETEHMEDRTMIDNTPDTQQPAQPAQDDLNASHDQAWMAMMDNWAPAEPPPAQWSTQPATQPVTDAEPGTSTATQAPATNRLRIEPVDEDEEEQVANRDPEVNINDVVAAALETTATLNMMMTQMLPAEKERPARKVSISVLALELDRRIEETPCHCDEATRLVCDECRREFFLTRKCNAAALVRWNVHKHNPSRYAPGTCPICHTVSAKFKNRDPEQPTSSSSN
jgi:rubrerythrin